MTKALSSAVVIVVLIILINHLKLGDGSCDTLSTKSGCLCPGSSIVFECTINTSTAGLTVWEAAGCGQDVVLDHSDFVNMTGTGCSNVHGKGISTTNSCFVSELTIENISESSIGGNVTCLLDVGSSQTIIGHRMLSIPTSDSLSINHLRRTTSPPGVLSFTWDPLSITDCPSLRYNIITAESCGSCPTSVPNATTTCRNVRRGRNCTISVSVDLCGNQIRSNAITVSTGGLPFFTNVRQIGSAEEPLAFTWDLINSSYCSSINYTINATEGCGVCSLSRNQQENTATCRRSSMRRSTCIFSVEANVCGDQIRSDAVIVNTGSSSGISTGGIIGIAIGVTAVAVLVGVIIAIGVIVMARKSRQQHGPSLELGPVGESGNGSPVVPDPHDPPSSQKNGDNTDSTSAVKFSKYQKKAPIAIGRGLKQAILNELTPITVFVDESDSCVQGELMVLSDSRNIPIQCNVTEIKRNEHYELEYTPTVRGQHQLRIKVNDKEIEGSPYSVIVKPSVDMLGTPIRIISGVNQPSSLAVNKKGEILVVEGGKQRVSVINSDGINHCSFGSPSHLGARCLREPQGVAVCEDGTVLVADSGRHCISLFTLEGEFIKSHGKQGNGPLHFNKPMGIGIHPITKNIYVTEYKNHRIQILSPKFEFVASFGSMGKDHGKFKKPWDISFDNKGDLYVADSGNHRIQVFERRDDNLHFLRTIGEKGRGEGQLMWPSSVFVDDESRVYVTEDDNYRVSVFTHVGKFLKSFGKKGKLKGEFDLPHGIVTDMNGDIYISDHKNNRLQVF